MQRSVMTLIVFLTLIAAAPGSAQALDAAPGSADPLGLAAIGLVIPFFASPGNVSYLELDSPVGANNVGVQFFTAACNRAGDTLAIPLTANDIQVFELAAGSAFFPVNFNGLAVIGKLSDDGFRLVALDNPIHARVRWVNAASNFVRTLDPITVANPEGASSQTWNPLRTAATFIAPLQVSGEVSTALYPICPSSTVTQASTDFPALSPPGATQLKLRVYDDDEKFLRDTTVDCTCLTRLQLTDISPVYSDVVHAPRGTYTKIQGAVVVNEVAGLGSFTGYIATRSRHHKTLRDDFTRLRNGSEESILEGVITRDR